MDGRPPWNPPAFWEDLDTEPAAGLELAEETLEDAVREARALIEAIDAASAQWTPLCRHSLTCTGRIGTPTLSPSDPTPSWMSSVDGTPWQSCDNISDRI